MKYSLKKIVVFTFLLTTGLNVKAQNQICNSASGLPAADVTIYKGTFDQPNQGYCGGWVLNLSNTTPQTVDMYIDDHYIGSTTATATRADVANVFSIPGNTLVGFGFHYDNTNWYKDGQAHILKACFGGYSTPISPPFTISQAGNASGVCTGYPSSVALNSFAGNVTYSSDINPTTLGYSKTPATNSYDYMDNGTIKIGFCNNMGGVIDYISRSNETVSYTNQFDSGRQIGIDPYFGPSDKTFYDNLGYVSMAESHGVVNQSRQWNGLPQGAFDACGNTDNFGGNPITKSYDPSTKTYYTKSNLWQFGYRYTNGAKVPCDAEIEKSVRFVSENVLEVKIKFILHVSYMNGQSSNGHFSPYMFINSSMFPIATTYNGVREFSNDAITSLNTHDLDNSTFNSPVISFNSYEKWFGLFNEANNWGVSMVWDDVDNFNSLVGQYNTDEIAPDANGCNYMYHYMGGTFNPNSTVERTFYLVIGSPQQARDFSYTLHGINAIPPTPNISPIANNDNGTIDQSNVFSIDVTLNDTDNDGTINKNGVDLNTGIAGIQNTYTATNQGTYTVNNNGIVTFTPLASFVGTSTISYTITDNQGGTSNPATLTIVVSASPFINVVVPAGGTWKYWDRGSLPAADWNTNAYNDATWLSANAEFGYGDGDEVKIVDFGTDPQNKYITTYFRKDISIGNIPSNTQLQGRVKIDDGAVVYINGQEIFKDNLPETVNYTTYAVNPNINENIWRNFPIPSTALQNGTNSLAVEIHQATATSSDLSFDMEIVATNAIVGLTEATSNFTIYPNPTKDVLYIQNNGVSIQQIGITNAMGQVVIQNKDFSNSISTSTLAAGVYYLQITTTQGVFYEQFIVTK